MVEKREILEKYIKEKLKDFSLLGKNYDDAKIKKLIDNLVKSDKSVAELKVLVDNKFSLQLRKLNHNNHLSSLKSYYLSNIEKLKKGNNFYLLSYDNGVKVLEQAKLEEVNKTKKSSGIVRINDDMLAYKKDNSTNNDYELIISDIAFLLGMDYAKTYRIFDGRMEAAGILNECFDSKTERFLNLEDTLSFVKEESSKFTLKEWLVEFYDCHEKKDVKTGLKDNIDYVFKLFEALPDINKNNLEKLKKDYLNMVVFEVLINNIDLSFESIGIVVNKKNLKYTYRVSSSYNYTFKSDLQKNELLFNFGVVTKSELVDYIISQYYDYVKELVDLISHNRKTLIPLMEQIIEEHLEFDESIGYSDEINDNVKLIATTYDLYKIMDSDDEIIFRNNTDLYENRIAPFIDNYAIVSDEKGETVFFNVAVIILVGTVLLIGIAIILISNTNF